jgi:threonine aldolase
MQIDLRSDTFTVATSAMRKAMAEADVGDDVWGEDPTVERLQQVVAQQLDKEAALFLPSGTMANQVALLTHCQRGEQVLGGWGSHVNRYEGGAAAALAGVQFCELGQSGFFSAQQLASALPIDDIHFAPCSLVWFESTHNKGGGRIFEPAAMSEVAAFAHQAGLRCHLDGARLYNAAVALNCPIKALASPADSLSICLSKGLGAPAGSLLAGSSDFIVRARRWRKRLGGAMRQVGHLAAAGLYALEHHVKRLAEDHENARLLAERLAEGARVEIQVSNVETNMVLFEHDRPTQLIERCAAEGVRLTPFGARAIRATTHFGVDREQCKRAARIINKVA